MPDIQAEVMAALPDTDDTVEFHSFRYEVFDLPGLNGPEDQLELAESIRAAAVNDAGEAMRQFAWQGMPQRHSTHLELEKLNGELARMASTLAEALAALTNARWWIDSEISLRGSNAYELIIAEAARLRRT